MPVKIIYVFITHFLLNKYPVPLFISSSMENTTMTKLKNALASILNILPVHTGINGIITPFIYAYPAARWKA
ncbi:hypothetical protein [Neomoorella thermoacetica]|uniref:hypothetical protein n=1 Tax=Neomoorella thermoacetica TaxID=1525 RepID=UPI000470CFD6|nr:hypothetical protein [Moorella thermoacetica]